MSDILNKSDDTINLYENKKKKRKGEEDKDISLGNKKSKKKNIGDFQSWKEVPWKLHNGDDPGVFFHFAEPNVVHAAMALPHVLPAGLVLGTTANNSLNNLKHWVRAQMTAVVPDCQVPFVGGGGMSLVAYHHITFVEYMACQQRLNIIPWSAACLAVGLSCGNLYTVTNAGIGSNEATNVRIGPFL